MIGLAAAYATLALARSVLAWRHAQAIRSEPDQRPLTIIQPILSGDPLLERALRANMDAHPDASFLWLIDETDLEARRIAAELARQNLRIALVPGPRDGENPKMAKLEHALNQVSTPRVMVLDDDTVLPPGAAFPERPLATGLPVFAACGSIWERLTGGFVNGNSALTYLPAAHLGLQRTINGMIYVADVGTLRRLGGFRAAGHEITDDYAVARLFLRNGFSLAQTAQPALVSMTIASFGQYARVMRRWMIFASHYFRDNLGFSTLFWIGLPAILPAAGLIVAVFEQSVAWWIALLLAKALMNRLLLWKLTGIHSRSLDLLFETAADLLMPAWALVALIRPAHLTWRTRKIDLSSGTIRYK